MNPRKEILSISDDETNCCCCGKTGLKRVVYIRDTTTGDVAWFGTTCAEKQAGVLFGEMKQILHLKVLEKNERILEELRTTPEFIHWSAREKEWNRFRSAHNIKPGAKHYNLYSRFIRDTERAMNKRHRLISEQNA